MSNVPICVGWKVIIEPKEAKVMSDGGIDISASADAEEHLVYIGTIVAIGEAAFMSRTQGGLDMSKWKVRPEVGDHVIFPPYGGLRIRRVGNKRILKLMNDTDISAIIDNPDDYYAWVDA